MCEIPEEKKQVLRNGEVGHVQARDPGQVSDQALKSH